MANIKKFEKPVGVAFRMEEATKKRIDAVAVNKNDWLNEAVIDKLNKPKIEDALDLVFNSGLFSMYGIGNFDISLDNMKKVVIMALQGCSFEEIEEVYHKISPMES